VGRKSDISMPCIQIPLLNKVEMSLLDHVFELIYDQMKVSSS
jgi:hypothetical protein